MLDTLRRLEEHTDSLEQLGVRQKDGSQPRPWWADGEYDDKRADAANDAGARRYISTREAPRPRGRLTARVICCTGMSHLSHKNFRNAYDAFTEAIRLSPLKVGQRLVSLRPTAQSSPRLAQAVYHANRASVALHLGNHAGAVEDAEQALRLSPTYASAHLRAAKAHLALRQPLVRTLPSVNLLPLRA